jgi:hypothetical protein
MILVSAMDLVENMVVARDVYGGHNQVLVGRGACLNAANIRILQRLDAAVYIFEEEEDECSGLNGHLLETATETTDELKAEFCAAMEQAYIRFNHGIAQRHLCIDIQQAEKYADYLSETILKNGNGSSRCWRCGA